MSFRSRASLLACVASAVVTTSAAVRGEQPFDLSPTDVASAFFIAKSQNRNQVHYGVHVDRECRPLGDAPVFAYWRMLENGGQLEPLLDREVPVYGLCEDQKVAVSEAGHATIHVCLRALPDRPVRVTVERTAGGCRTTATTTIAGTEAKLRFVYVRLAWLGIDYLLLRGTRPESRASIEEIVRP